MTKNTWGDVIDSYDSESFIGRKDELDVFNNEIRKESFRYLIYFISGQGGVGKTELMKRYKEFAENSNCLTVECDENQGNIPAILNRFARQIEQKGESLTNFTKKHEKYRQLKQEIESDPDAPQGLASFIGESIAHVGLALADDVPVLRHGVKLLDKESISSQAGEWAKYLSQKWTNKYDEIELIKNPVPILSEQFLSDLNKIAEECKIILFFENYEITRGYLDSWLNNIREYQPSTNIRIAIACRTIPSTSWEKSNNVMIHIPLDVFTEDEANEFLDRNNILDENRREEIMQFSGRLPVFMKWLSSQNSDNPDPVTPTADIVDRFLRWVNDPNLKIAALEASIPRFFNIDILSCIHPAKSAPEIESEFEWLRKQPFISQHNYGWQYHSVVRKLMLHYQNQRSSNKFQTVHKQLEEFYLHKFNELKIGKNKWANEQAQSYKAEYCYHKLMQSPEKNWAFVANELVLALKYSMEYAKKLIGILSEPASLEILGEQKREIINLISDELNLFGSKYKNRWDGINLYEYLDENFKPNLPEALCHLYLLRAEAARIVKEDYDTALRLLEKAIIINPNYIEAIIEKGEVYAGKRLSEEAIKEFDKVIKVRKNHHYAHERKGTMLARVRRFEDALESLNKAEEAFKGCRAVLRVRGRVLFELHKISDAIDDFNRLLSKNPEDHGALMSRGEAYLANGDLDLALKDFEDIAAITNTKEHERLKNIGLCLLAKNRYEEAAKKFIKSLTLAPACQHCWAALVLTYEKYNPRNVVPELMAEKNLPEINFDPTVKLVRGVVLVERDYLEGYSDIKEYLNLNSNLKSEYEYRLNNLGLMLSESGKYEDAIECFENDNVVDEYMKKYNIAIAKVLWKGADYAKAELRMAKIALNKIKDKDENLTGISLYGLAGIKAANGNKKKAFNLLDKAVRLDKEVLRFAESEDPAWKSFRSNEEFLALISSLKMD